MKTLYFYLIFLLSLHFSANAQIPDSLKSDWNKSGLDSSFTIPSNSIDITTFGAIPNDGLDDYAALASAFTSISGSGAVINFPSGIFNFSSTISFPSNCIIKGNSADSTFFVFNLNNAVANCINFVGSASPTFFPIIGGLERNSNKIIVAGADTLFSIGDRVELREQNGSWDTNPATWATYSVGHVTTIDSINADTIFMREALRISFDTLLNPEIRKIICVENSGLECLSFTRTDSLAPSVNYGIYFYFAYNCRVSGIESYKSIGAHIWSEISAHLEISNNYFHEAYTYDGSNTRGYGVIMAVHTVSARIENNIFRKLRHSMMVKQGANGNVFAYNYSFEPTRSEFPTNAGADICMHGHYPFANLFEGNICQNAGIDQAYGPNGPLNAIFRNRLDLYGLVISSGTIQSDQQILVGNDIPSTVFLQGLYVLYGVNHFQQANRVQGTVTPSGTNTLTDTSLFLTSPPAYWTASLNWPSIGIPVLQTANQLPATTRFLQGGPMAQCEIIPDSSLTSIQEIKTENAIEIKNIILNTDFLKINWRTSQQGSYTVIVFDILGNEIYRQSIKTKTGDQETSVKINLAAGQYLLCIQNENNRTVKKFIAFDNDR